MFDGDNTGPVQRRKSLLSFGRHTAGDAGSVPRRQATEGSRQFDDAARHRLARSRRETRSGSLLDAVDDRQAAEPSPAASAGPHHAGPDDAGVRSAAQAPDEGVRTWLRHAMRGLFRPGGDSRDERRPRLRREGASVDAGQEFPHPPVHTGDGLGAGVRRPIAGDEFWTPLIDPMRVIGAIAESRRLIVATTVLGALVGVAIALSTPKKFEAATELLIDPRELKLSNLDLTEPGLPSDATLAIVENQVRVLTSGAVLGKVVDKLNLDADPEFNGSRRSFGPRAVIGELRSMLSRSSDDDSAASGRRHTLAIENLASSLSVERSGKTFVVTIGVQSESADKSALIANTMADVFLQTYGQLQAQTAGRASDELSAGLDNLRREVEAAERLVAGFKAENEIIDPQGRLITDDELVKLNDQLAVARARTLELNAKAASARDLDVDNVLSGAFPETVNSATITELRSQYASLKTEADRMAVRLGPRHPDRMAAEAQLASAREQIAAELRRVAASIQVELKRAVELEQQLAKRLAQLKVRQGDVGADLVRLRELEREAAAKRAVYESSLLRAKQTGEQRDVNTANVTVISKAYAPLQPVGPSRAVISAFGMILGFASGVGLAALRGAYEALRDRRREHASAGHDRYGRDDGVGPSPAAPGGGPSGGWSRDETRSASPPAGHVRSGASSARAQDRSTRSPAEEENAMPPRAADPYYPVAQLHNPLPIQDWGPPAQPMPPVAAHPGYAYAAYAEPAQPMPAYAYPQPASGYAVHAYAPPPPAHAYAAPVVGYPQPAPWPQPYPAPFPQAAYPQQAYPYAPQSAAGQPPAYGHHSAPAQTIPFPGRHAPAAAPRQPAENEAASRAIDDIRASLAEFREAVRDFTESRQKRRFL